MLRTRLLVAVVALPIVVGVTAVGGVFYCLVLAALLLIGAREMVLMARAGGYGPSVTATLGVLAAILAGTYWPEVLEPGLALIILVTMAVTLVRFQRGDQTPLNSFSIMLGVGLYLGLLGSRLLLLRFLPSGEWWTLFILFTTFSADTGAYAIGKTFGKRKLAPKISPKKTWEGYIAGVATGALFGALVGAAGAAQLPGITPLHGLMIGFLIGAITPLGDLLVSAFKREAHVKDSSRLIPGHGGMMDRLDSILVSAVIGFYYLVWFVL
jgi:phosphatidate cytidylyltransferase